jgi:hypothetical protein
MVPKARRRLHILTVMELSDTPSQPLSQIHRSTFGPTRVSQR